MATAAHAQVRRAIAVVAEQSPASVVAAHRDWIDECFAVDSVSRILAALDAAGVT